MYLFNFLISFNFVLIVGLSLCLQLLFHAVFFVVFLEFLFVSRFPGDFDKENSFNSEDNIGDISFAFSEPDIQPQSINIDICNGSPLNPQYFKGAHCNINSITAPGRIEALNSVSSILSLSYLVINQSKLDNTIPTSLICLDNFHEPLRRERNRYGGGLFIVHF